MARKSVILHVITIFFMELCVSQRVSLERDARSLSANSAAFLMIICFREEGGHTTQSSSRHSSLTLSVFDLRTSIFDVRFDTSVCVAIMTFNLMFAQTLM